MKEWMEDDTPRNYDMYLSMTEEELQKEIVRLENIELAEKSEVEAPKVSA